MLIPHPESNIGLNILVLGAEIIQVLNEKSFKDKFCIVDDVLESFLKYNTSATTDSFLYSLTFLHLIGCIERKGYRIKLVKSGGQMDNRSRQRSLFE